MKKLKELNQKDNYLLACSFGPDSMSLFYMLKKQGIHFEVAHVNYGLREEAKLETTNLEKYCKENNVICHTLFATVKPNKNIEKQCRDIRYHFFKELNDKYHYSSVLVAHNLDDVIETYIMQKKRKNIVKTYGIDEKTMIEGVTIYRPLLKIRKDELLKICKNNSIPYAIDSSNLKDDFLRNKIRHQVVSKMSDEAVETIEKEILEKDKHQNEIFSKLDQTDLSCAKSLLCLTDEEFILYANREIKHFNESYFLSAKYCLELKHKLLINHNFVSEVKKDVLFVNEYGKVGFFARQNISSYQLNIDAPCLINNEYFYFDFSKDLSKHHLSMDDFPLTIRTYQKGDQYFINGYPCEVRRLFIDWKIPILTRKYWPLIVNRYGRIQYIPRYRSDFDVSKTPDFYVKIH